MCSLFIKEGVLIEEVACGVAPPTPTLVNNTKSTVQVTERQIVSTNEAVIALLAAYYCFNIEYPRGSLLFFTALKILILVKVPKKIHSKIFTCLVSTGECANRERKLTEPAIVSSLLCIIIMSLLTLSRTVSSNFSENCPINQAE